MICYVVTHTIDVVEMCLLAELIPNITINGIELQYTYIWCLQNSTNVINSLN